MYGLRIKQTLIQIRYANKNRTVKDAQNKLLLEK